MLERRAVVEAILRDRGEAVVVTGLGTPTWDVAALGSHPRNYYLWGAMGGAVPVGLGLALARPELPVIVVTGDGEMLMGLGALATVAVQAPGNLAILVLDNERFGETGMQASHTGRGADLAAVAAGCGISRTFLVRDAAGLADLAARFHEAGAPRLAVAKVSAEEAPRVMPTRDGVDNRNAVRRAIGVVE